jgi:two-component system chemotaxis sensor kinase CheA
MLGAPADDARVWDLLRGKDQRVADAVEGGWMQLADGWLPRELALDQLPTRLVADERVLELAWGPAGRADEVMLVVTDVTERMLAEAERAAQEELVALLTRMRRDRRSVMDFFAEAGRTVDALVSRSGTPAQEGRWIHTLKGNSAVMGLDRLARWLHGLETAMAERCGEWSDDERQDLLTQWADLVSRASVLVDGDDTHTVRVAGEELDHTVQLVVAGEPRSNVAARMQAWTWDTVDGRLEQLADQARRLADRFGKHIEVAVEHNGLRTPPTEQWSAFWGAMVHVVRNAVDHGIESDRVAVGKPSRGMLRLAAVAQPGGIRVEIEDDGGGIDWSTIGEKARSLGLPFESDADRAAALMTDGVTSRVEVTEISGRGIGAAALREAVIALGGTVRIASDRGRYTRFTIALPLAGAAEAATSAAA